MPRGPLLLLVVLLLAAGGLLALLAFAGGTPEMVPSTEGAMGQDPAVRRAGGRGAGEEAMPRVEAPRAEATGLEDAPQPEAAEGGSAVTVRTLFEDGTPVPWVIVELVRPGTSGYEAGEKDAVTDLEGVARFEGVAGGDWIARTDRFVEQPFTLALEGPRGEVRIVLPRGVEVEGIVLDPAGAPMAGAEIWRGPMRDWRETHRVEARCRPVTVSGADGSFRLPGFKPEPVSLWLAARHPRHAPSAWTRVSYHGFYNDATERVALRLRSATHTLVGRVTSSVSGEPLGGAGIEVTPVSADRETLPDGTVLDFRHRSVGETSPDGSFQVQGLFAGTLSVRVTAQGHVPRVREIVLERGVPAKPLDFALGAARQFALRVVDPADRPLEAVRCTLTAASGTRRTARTDGEGRCTFEDLPGGSARLLLERDGFWRKKEEVELSEPPSEREREVVLEPRPQLLGRLLDAGGMPLAGWLVGARRPPSEPGAAPESLANVRTGEEGLFALPLDDREPVLLSAWYGEGLAMFIHLAEGRPVVPTRQRIDFMLPPGPPRGGEVTAVVEAGHRPWFTLIHWREGRSAGRRSGQAIQAAWSADSGRLRLGPLVPGDYRLEIEADPPEGRNPFRRGLSFQSEVFTVTEGGTTELGVLAVPPHGRLRWVLRPGRGCTPREPRIQWAPRAGTPGTASLQMIDPRLREGALTGELPLLPGAYEVTFWGEGFLSETRRIELAADETLGLDLALHAAQRLPILLTLPEGTDRATFEIRDPRGVLVHEDDLGIDEARSVVRYPVLPRGRHDVRVTAGDAAWTGHFEVTALTPTRVPLRFDLHPAR